MRAHTLEHIAKKIAREHSLIYSGTRRELCGSSNLKEEAPWEAKTRKKNQRVRSRNRSLRANSLSGILRLAVRLSYSLATVEIGMGETGLKNPDYIQDCRDG